MKLLSSKYHRTSLMRSQHWFRCLVPSGYKPLPNPMLTRTYVAILGHGPLTKHVKLRVAHAPGMPGTFSLPPRVSDPDMHHDTCVTHVSWCMPGSLARVFLCRRWRGKCSRHSRRMHDRQCYVSGKRPMVSWHLPEKTYSGALGVGVSGLPRGTISWPLLHFL